MPGSAAPHHDWIDLRLGSYFTPDFDPLLRLDQCQRCKIVAVTVHPASREPLKRWYVNGEGRAAEPPCFVRKITIDDLDDAERVRFLSRTVG